MENNINLENGSNLPPEVPLGIKIISFLPGLAGLLFLFGAGLFGAHAREVEAMLQFILLVVGAVFMLIQIPFYYFANKKFSSKTSSDKKRGSRLMLFFFIVIGVVFVFKGVASLVQVVVFDSYSGIIFSLMQLIIGISIVSYFVFNSRVKNFYQTSERTDKLLKVGFIIFLIGLIPYAGLYFKRSIDWKNYTGSPQESQDIKSYERDTQEKGVAQFDDLSKNLGLEKVMSLGEVGLSEDQLEKLKDQPPYYGNFEVTKNEFFPKDFRFLRKGDIKLIIELGFPYTGGKGVWVHFAPMWSGISSNIKRGDILNLEEFGKQIKVLIDLQERGLLK